LQHLGNRIAMNPKSPRSLAVAQPINHHGTPHSTIKFHSKHPSSQSMPVEGINRRSRTGTLLRRHKGRKKAGSVVHFAAAIYSICRWPLWVFADG
jgi:hypothetical protein